MNLNAESFRFQPTAAAAQTGALESVVDQGSLFTAWNPNDHNTALKPGMKVMFFGTAQGCAAGTQGPLLPIPKARLDELADLTGFPAIAVLDKLTWTPSGNAEGCDGSTRSRSGGSSVFINADDQRGAVAILTTSGPQSDGVAPFLGPFDAKGQNGTGANAHIMGSFVNFRHAWWKADPLQPWLTNGVARLQSVQSIGVLRVAAASSVTAQVKQQMMATFLNTTCAKELGSQGKPCQIQYLFNTGIQRTGVSDWSTVDWFNKPGIWFDPAQGNIPVVDGPVPVSGQTAVEPAMGVALYTSQGSSTQHKAFTGRVFDVAITFAQLQHVLRYTTAKATSSPVSSVSESQLQREWGSEWNQPSAWVLLSADIGQEVYNPDTNTRVEIAGGFTSIYAGAQ
ncbi:hypothetical protein [Ideonella sp.]|uniref:hypothetical protein n=1 Tax=Ideonella sp. TaxID=1929293 RepID=UPI0037BF890F